MKKIPEKMFILFFFFTYVGFGEENKKDKITANAA